MEKVRTKPLNLGSYLGFEKKSLLVALIIAALLISLVRPQYILIVIGVLVLIIVMRFKALNGKYTQYSVEGKNRWYYLFSKLKGVEYNIKKGEFNEQTAKGYFLEDLLFDFTNCNWDDASEVSSYKKVICLVSIDGLPDAPVLISPSIKKQMREHYQGIMNNLDNNTELKAHLEELSILLTDVYFAKRSYNIQKGLGRLGSLVDKNRDLL